MIGRLRRVLRGAFAVDPPGPAEPSEEERPLIDRICREVVRRGMTTPALLALEMSRPLNYLSAQAMHFFQPFATVLVRPGDWERFAAFLERRGSIEHLLSRIEAFEAERGTGADDAGDAPPAATPPPREPDRSGG